MMKRVLMITPDHMMIDRRILQEAKSLVAAGYHVKLLAGFECKEPARYTQDGFDVERYTYDWSDPNLKKWTLRLRLKIGSKAHQKFVWFYRRLCVWLDLPRGIEAFVVDRIREQAFDILHIHDFPFLRAGVTAARLMKKAVIYDMHEIYYDQVQLPRLIRWHYRRREKRWIQFCTKTIIINPYAADKVAADYKVARPLVLLNAAPALPVTDRGFLRQKLGLSGHQKIVLFQGWISAERGIDVLIRALQHCDLSIVLVVIGYGGYLDELRKITEDLKLGDRVFFTGAIPSEDLHPYTCGADLGVIPYHGVDSNNFYCSPNKLFEYIVAEIPCLTNQLPYLQQVLSTYQMGKHCNLQNAEETGAMFDVMLNDAATLDALRKGAREAKRDLNWEVEEQKLLKHYHDIV